MLPDFPLATQFNFPPAFCFTLRLLRLVVAIFIIFPLLC